MTIALVLVYLLAMWLESRPLLKKRHYWDLAVMLTLYLLSLIPAVLLIGGHNLPAVNTFIRLLIKRVIGKS